MKRIFSILLALCLLPVFACAEEGEAEHPVVRISIENYGDIYAELYPETAPITVENFLDLVDSGFYNGLTFHRIISGFMIQGGDPLGNGTGGSGKNIKGEFSGNGVDNPLKHARGVLSMARSQQNDSASSQFFIMHADASHLDGSYAAFGQVLAGMPVVDRICGMTPVEDGNGSVLRENQPVITTITRADRSDAEAAAEAEALNGKNGVYADPNTTVSFLLPKGWTFRAASGDISVFSDSEERLFQVTTHSLWASNASVRTSMLRAGLTRADASTDKFSRDALAQMLTDDPDSLREETHNGVLYYSADIEGEKGILTNWLGIDKGIIIIATTDQAADAVRAVLDNLTVE